MSARSSNISVEPEYAGVYAASAPGEIIGNSMASETVAQGSVRAAQAAFSMPRVEISNGIQEAAFLGGLRTNVAAVAMSSPNIKI